MIHQHLILAVTPLMERLDQAWQQLLEHAISWTPRALLALVVLAFTMICARTVGRHGQKLTRRIVGDDEQLARVLTTMLKSLVILAGIFVMLEVAGLEAMREDIS